MIRWIGFTLNLLLIAALVIAYLAPVTDPRVLWFPALAGLAFPLLALLNLVFLLSWLLLRRWTFALIAGLALLPAIRETGHYLGFHAQPVEGLGRPGNAPLQVMSWNVRVFNKNNPDGRFEGRQAMLDRMQEGQPDLLCLQEFYTVPGSTDADHEQLVRQATGLENYRLLKGLQDRKGRQWGLAVFSRFPILESGEIDFPGGGVLNGCLYVDIKAPSGRLRLFNVHLQSIHLSPVDYSIDDAMSELSEAQTRRATLLKFREAYQARAEQASLVQEAVRASPWPVILCGDFNDPPQSYAYQRFQGLLNDAFSQAGQGLARTHATLPGMRIDYVLSDSAFTAYRYESPAVRISDHFPVQVELYPVQP